MVDLAARVAAGDRRALAKAITLVESTAPAHEADARRLLSAALPRAGGAFRIGLSGAPGAGKSTFIEAFGMHLIGAGHRVAVLAVDPSSQRSGGSILGDKTRMDRLSRAAAAFIRPSPAGATLGGVARRTREAMVIVEAAGFDVVIVETVGVGQSETAVAGMTDAFVLLLAPGGGDELQGMKRGIMEAADLVAVNKADGDLAMAARRAAADVQSALHYMRPKHAAWSPETLTISALESRGIDTVWQALQRYRAAVERAGLWAERRRQQAKAWLWDELKETLLAALAADPRVAGEAGALEEAVAAGRLLPAEAAERMLALFRA